MLVLIVLVCRLPGTMDTVETESRAAVQQGGRGNTRTPSWRLEVQHSHTAWVGSLSLIPLNSVSYAMLT